MLRLNASIWLAPWHNYKHAVELVWKQFANFLFAPLFHELYPRNKFIIKYPSPQEPTMFLLLLAKAYPKFKEPLNAAIARLTAAEKTAANFRKSAMLKDLQMLVEFAIPTVRFPIFPVCKDPTHERKKLTKNNLKKFLIFFLNYFLLIFLSTFC